MREPPINVRFGGKADMTIALRNPPLFTIFSYLVSASLHQIASY
jgi:hypothetical protein